MRKQLFLPFILFISGCAFWRSPRPTEENPLLAIQRNDHIGIIGGGLADRMQHSGYLEALIHQKYPDYNLVFRNLGFAGDEVVTRMRSENFGSPHDWLKHEKATIVWAFFGYNESFKGKEGLDGFRKDLENFIKETRQQDYAGLAKPPQIILFSPTAAEKHPDPNFPDPAPLNTNIKMYADAMAEVAKANAVPFVDLYTPSLDAYKKAKSPLTINAVHLNDTGYKALAPAMYRSLAGEEAPAMSGKKFDRLVAAVNEKNKMFFSRYRTMDGYNVYGGRSFLEFDGVKNRDAMQREMEIRDVMTSNRDRKVWSAAQGRNLVVKDNNLPPPVEVKTNKPGKGPEGSHLFISGEEGIKHMKVPPGCKVNLFASEEQFPDLENPVQMAFDTRGRLWVAAWPNYPERTPQSKKGDSLLVFEDTNDDGKADKVTTFIDDLNCPTGFQFYKDGVILVQAPDVWFVRDTDGDGKADWKERVLDGLDSADSHHTANSLCLEPGGAIYLSDGVFHRTQMESPWGPPVRNMDAAIHRFEPRTCKIERYVSYGFANAHGRVFDYWGNDLITDATGNNTYFGPAFSGYIDFPDKHSELRQFWNRPSRPCPGTGILSSRHFPEEFQDNFLNCNVIGFQGIYRVKVRAEEAGLWGDTIDAPLVQSDDPNFRPTAVDVAPDGSIYFLDWHNPIIGHMQHHIRDPNRDHVHGRIYRITYEGRPLLTPAPIAGQPIEKLLDLLKEPENNVRTRAKIELGARDTNQVIAALKKWAKQFDPAKVEDQHHLMEALWVHQWHNVVNEPLLHQMLKSPDQRARAQAVRVLCYWRDRVSHPLDLLRSAANDAAPRVRLEALRALSFFKGDDGREALEIAHDALKQPADYYLDYIFKETKRQLTRNMNGVFLPKDSAALAALIPRLSDQELLQAAPIEPILVARLTRPGINVTARTDALAALAPLRKTDMAGAAVGILREISETGGDPAATSAAADVGFILASLSPKELAAQRNFLRTLAVSKTAHVSRAGYAALVAADEKPDAIWAETAAGKLGSPTALIESIGLQGDVAMRDQFAPLVMKTLADPAARDSAHEAALRALPLFGRDHAKTSFAVVAAHLKEKRNMTAAARSAMQLPRDSWDKREARAIADSVLEWAKSLPADKRSGEDYAAVTQAGAELAGLLPKADASRIRKEIFGLGVRVFVLQSVREQMHFDITRLVVEAGKQVEIIFRNDDMMPHNLSVMQPGARDAIGAITDGMAPNLDSLGRAFIPDDKRILAATKMAEPGMVVSLKFTAPKEPGDYEYVCTYPEHWKSMFGQLRVVQDMDAYLQSDRANEPPPVPPTAAPAAMHGH